MVSSAMCHSTGGQHQFPKQLLTMCVFIIPIPIYPNLPQNFTRPIAHAPNGLIVANEAKLFRPGHWASIDRSTDVRDEKTMKLPIDLKRLCSCSIRRWFPMLRSYPEDLL